MSKHHQRAIQQTYVWLRGAAAGVVSDPAGRNRLGPADRQTAHVARKPRHHAQVPPKTRDSGPAEKRVAPHAPADLGSGVVHRSPGLRGAGHHAGQLHRRRLRLRRDAQDVEARGRAAEQTQPATLAQAVYSDSGSGLSDPDPELSVDGEVSEGRADLSYNAPGGQRQHRPVDRADEGRAAVQDRVPHLSAQLCGTSAITWATAKFVSQLLGHRSVESTEVYTNVLTFDGSHFLEGVEFH